MKREKFISEIYHHSLYADERLFLYYTATLGGKQIRSAVHNHSADKQNNHPLHVTPKKIIRRKSLSPRRKSLSETYIKKT